jgi:hypothetical protein
MTIYRCRNCDHRLNHASILEIITPRVRGFSRLREKLVFRFGVSQTDTTGRSLM